MKHLSPNIKADYGLLISQQFYDNFKHILYVNKFVGLFPISITKKGEFYKLEWSWLKVIIGNFFVFVFAIVTLTGVIFSYDIEQVRKIRIGGLASLMVTLAEILTLLSTWLVGQTSVAIFFKEFWRYLIFLTKADDITGPVQPPKTILIVILLAFAFTFTCLGMDIYMWAQITLPSMGSFDFAWKMVPFYYTYLFSMILEINVWVISNGIILRAKKLNSLMTNYIGLMDDCDRFQEEEKNALPGTINKTKAKFKSPFRYTMPNCAMIKNFLRAYGHLFDANMALNKFLGVSMTILLFNVIVCLVITPYILYQQILNGKENKFLFTQSYWMTCHILRLLLLIEPCHNGQIQGQEIKKSVVKMLSFDLPQETREQAKLLLLTITENNIHFNARGMIIINRTLLPTISSAVFTYLAILFQYDNDK